MQSPLQGLRRWFSWPALHLSAIAIFLLNPGSGGLMFQARAQTETEGVEVLTRGPVHEAFAATINFKATEGLIVPKAPPEAIQELPPEQRPEGDTVTWIPGYWAWDDETTGFLWVSGIWRNLPPGRQWIPGYWWESTQGHQWISGFWADAETDEVEYLSEPPASLEVGPNIAAPSRSHTWIPGTWRWSDSQYAWQAGYWYEAQPDWVWVPPYYSWAPQGWLYVDGYYDYDMPRRGLVFAPVRFSAGYRSRPDSVYRPTTVISLSVFSNHLFLRPRNRHYYFGDYYAPEYRRSGYFASFNYSSGGHGYDPIYAHERWRNRDDDRWQRRHEDDFAYYRDHESARPPHTLAALGNFLARPDRNRRPGSDFATRLDQLDERKNSPYRLKKVDEVERKSFTRRGQEIRDFGDQRRKMGGRGAEADRPGPRGDDDVGKRKPETGKSVRVRIPKSPVMARAEAGTTRPPRRPNASPDRETTGGEIDRNPNRENPRDRDDPKKGPEIAKEQPAAVVPEGRVDPRRGRQDPKSIEQPKIDRTDPPARERPKVDPREPVREKSTPESAKPSNREPNPETRPQPRENTRQPGRKPEADPSPNREPKTKKAQPPPEKPRRADPPPVTKLEPARKPTVEPTRKPKAEPKREARPDRQPKPAAKPRTEPNPERKVEPKREAKAKPKREPKPEPKREAPAPPRKKPQVSPTPPPSAPTPAPEKPKRGKAKPDPEEDKKKKKGGQD